MGRTERSVLVVGSIVWLFALSAATGVAAPVASDGASERSSTLSESPAAFAERVTASHGPGAGGRGSGSLQNAIELIVLATACAIGVAFYSAASAPSDGTRVPAHIRRR
jgi:hypothetical protein